MPEFNGGMPEQVPAQVPAAETSPEAGFDEAALARIEQNVKYNLGDADYGQVGEEQHDIDEAGASVREPGLANDAERAEAKRRINEARREASIEMAKNVLLNRTSDDADIEHDSEFGGVTSLEQENEKILATLSETDRAEAERRADKVRAEREKGQAGEKL